MNYCPLCNWEIFAGRCSNRMQCTYIGRGVTKKQRDEAADAEERLNQKWQNNGSDVFNY